MDANATTKLHHYKRLLISSDGMYEEFKLDLIPLDDDILSLELPDFFKAFFLVSDCPGSLTNVIHFPDVRFLFFFSNFFW